MPNPLKTVFHPILKEILGPDILCPFCSVKLVEIQYTHECLNCSFVAFRNWYAITLFNGKALYHITVSPDYSNTAIKSGGITIHIPSIFYPYELSLKAVETLWLLQ